MGKDLLDQQDPVRSDVGTQPLQVVLGVRQTVRVVDAKTVHEVFLDELTDQVVGGRVDSGVLLSQPRQTIDGEEAAIADDADVPGHQPVMLPVMHFLGGLAGFGAGGERKPVFVEREFWFVPTCVHLERCHVVGGPENRQRDLAVGPVVRRPVDVEVVGVLGRLTVAQYVPPPRILPRVLDPGVIGDDVDDHTDAAVGCSRPQFPQSLDPTERLGDRGRRNPVVPVRRALLRGLDRRQVQMADAQPFDVVELFNCVGEGELAVQLKPVGGRQRQDHGYSSGCRARPASVSGQGVGTRSKVNSLCGVPTTTVP